MPAPFVRERRRRSWPHCAMLCSPSCAPPVRPTLPRRCATSRGGGRPWPCLGFAWSDNRKTLIQPARHLDMRPRASEEYGVALPGEVSHEAGAARPDRRHLLSAVDDRARAATPERLRRLPAEPARGLDRDRVGDQPDLGVDQGPVFILGCLFTMEDTEGAEKNNRR